MTLTYTDHIKSLDLTKNINLPRILVCWCLKTSKQPPQPAIEQAAGATGTRG
jgi:hypothetical protein